MTNAKEERLWQSYNNFHYFCDSSRMQKLFARHQLFLKTVDLPGVIIDAGVFKGTSTLLFAHLLKIYSPHSRKRVIGFDTFDSEFHSHESYEAERAADFMKYHQAGMDEFLNGVAAEQGVSGYMELVKGDITETLPEYFETHKGLRVSLLHLDLDVFKPTYEVLQNAYDIMVPGGIIVFDEYGIEGWGESDAVSRFFSERGLKKRLSLVPYTATPTAFIEV
jgi:SAM-dependent methyltransferase